MISGFRLSNSDIPLSKFERRKNRGYVAHQILIGVAFQNLMCWVSSIDIGGSEFLGLGIIY